MLKLITAVTASLALASPVLAQQANEPAAEMQCVANLLLFRSAATKMLESTTQPNDRRVATQRLLADTNESLSWYIGRLSLQPASVDLQKLYAEAVGKSAAAAREDQVKMTFDCLSGATKARVAAAQRLLPKE